VSFREEEGDVGDLRVAAVSGADWLEDAEASCLFWADPAADLRCLAGFEAFSLYNFILIDRLVGVLSSSEDGDDCDLERICFKRPALLADAFSPPVSVSESLDGGETEETLAERALRAEYCLFSLPGQV